MDDGSFFDEKKSIRDSAQSLKKYGSTCNHVRNHEILIRHDHQENDTLQGLALKYGCTTEQIRRANRLYAQDSLFLRKFLMIPVDKDSPYYPKDSNYRQPQATSTRYSSYHNHLLPSTSSVSTNNNSNKKEQIMDSVMLSPEEENKQNINAFLGKIDSNLAETRKYVAKSQKSIEYLSDSSSSDFYDYPSTSSHHIRNNLPGYSSSSSTNNDTIQLLGMAQSRRVQNSLIRLEKQQDEFFEL